MKAKCCNTRGGGGVNFYGGGAKKFLGGGKFIEGGGGKKFKEKKAIIKILENKAKKGELRAEKQQVYHMACHGYV